MFHRGKKKIFRNEYKNSVKNYENKCNEEHWEKKINVIKTKQENPCDDFSLCAHARSYGDDKQQALITKDTRSL